MSLKKNEATSIVDKRPLGLCDSTEKIKSSSFKGKCSKSCTKSRKTSLNGLQTSDKPQTLRESSYRQKNSETKPTGEMPLFAQLKTKMKETSRKLQSTLPFFKKTTKRTMTRVRSLYVGSRAKRVLGFKCDLKKCNSTLMDCSAGACRKKSMIFSESNQPCSSKTIDRSVSDTSIKSSSSEGVQQANRLLSLYSACKPPAIPSCTCNLECKELVITAALFTIGTPN
ncbi:PREDICTED: uncharacterized protein LOC108780241 isoform X1 [Cyphomyrmex costatus]|uniref:uncharacterized protein LOC108780241 isoform X1 n=1 Tax=Cyphomyrmex costatus TaxID=456900 RepID=UPI0008522645|nr:PREDICTED: uncharacterized protein LOC108780241 isoform X1 [Cyphomyrmex costatus]